MKIILIGFMTSGKTTVARLIAEQLSLAVLETDEIIQQIAGKSIEAIFEESGETSFREYEITAAKTIRGKNNVVISTGGGVVMNKIILDYLKPDAKTFFWIQHLKTW